jgi:hypothetical protein
MRIGNYVKPPTSLMMIGFVGIVGWCTLNNACVAQNKPLIIEGRVEEVVRSATLPAIVLQKQTPKFDSPVLRGGAGEVPTGYPQYLLGRWGGKLRVSWSVSAPEVTERFPQDRIGNMGSVVFHFDKVAGRVKMLPTVVFFPVEHEKLTPELIESRKINSNNLDSFRKQVLETGTFTGVPTTCLARFSGQGLAGETFQSRPLYDSMRVLKNGTVEQDVVSADWRDNAIYSYREVVSRFTWYSANQVYAQIVVADYGKSRRALKRTLLEGWIGPNWQPVADNIAATLGRPWEQIMVEDGIE